MDWKIITHFFLLYFLYDLCCGKILEEPSNQVKNAGTQNVTISCQTDNLHEPLAWVYKGISSKMPSIEIVLRGVLLNKWAEQYKLYNDYTKGLSNLVIDSLKPSHAGRYTCIDEDAAGESASAEIGVQQGANPEHLPQQGSLNVTYFGNLTPNSSCSAVTTTEISNGTYSMMFHLNNKSLICGNKQCSLTYQSKTCEPVKQNHVCDLRNVNAQAEILFVEMVLKECLTSTGNQPLEFITASHLLLWQLSLFLFMKWLPMSAVN